ncbi:MAG: lysophospholipid acyltransferase family protein [Woeseiaceae bacterium]|nr:lysophospholipid acyltransferase family protein [Woeseiaceae bacterium]
MKYVTALYESLWGIYAWTVFLVSVLASLIVVTVVPSARWRRRFVVRSARSAFVLSGVDVRVDGIDRLPEEHCVVVANHASYVDGPLLKAYLPPRFSFVIKGEMRNVPVVHFLLRRSGARFVERFTAAGSARDARQIVKAAQDGQSLAFFPEGTFLPEVGVGAFRPGAFVAAVRGGMPVVPVAISGTRAMMPHGDALPKPRPLAIDILQPIATDDPAFADPRQLAEAARQRILAVLDEPDLLEKPRD